MPKYRVYKCQQCNARRRIYTANIVGQIHNMRCSQGHTWVDNFAKVNQVMKDIWLEGIAAYANNVNPLMAYMKGAT